MKLIFGKTCQDCNLIVFIFYYFFGDSLRLTGSKVQPGETMKVRNTYYEFLVSFSAKLSEYLHYEGCKDNKGFSPMTKPFLFPILNHSPRKSLQFTNLFYHRSPICTIIISGSKSECVLTNLKTFTADISKSCSNHEHD
jgi:hypothetical protein